MAHTDILVTVRREHASRFFQNLSTQADFRVRLVTNIPDAVALLDDRDKHIDLLVLDNGLEHAFETVTELRRKHPRLLIVLVDEEADFAMPGQADDITTEPFTNDDLVRRINRLMSDRHLETLRADIMPPVRDFTKKLRKAVGEGGKPQAAVSACLDLGYEYVAFYQLESLEPLQVTLKAQDGLAWVQAVAPKTASADDLIGWVATSGQSRIAAPKDALNHPLVRKGQLGAVACAAVGTTNRYGVLVACRSDPDSITQQQLMLLELVSAQLASVIAKEGTGSV
ncbi:MAG: GAF domain-containing protein [Anaerolineae bacterium]